MAINETIGLTASFTTAGGKVLSKRANNVIINDTGGESTLELREGTFTTLSGGTLTFANGSSVVFTPVTLTTHNVAAAQAGVANFKGTSPNYTVRGSSLVKVLKYPDNAIIIRHENSPNLIEVPQILPPNVTSMSYMFQNCTSFNQPLNTWNTGKVTNMSYMFGGATAFNQPLNTWNTANVTSMGGMFQNCTNFNQPLDNWNTANVTSMGGMFQNCTSFNQPLNTWNTGKVTSMTYMFQNCTKFNQDLSQWCVKLITSIPNSFNYNAPLLTAAKLPIWGTCPTPAN